MKPGDLTEEALLRRQKEELLALLLEEEGLAAPPARTLTRRERKEDLPLSFTQQRLWFLDALEPASSQYHIVKAVRLSGALDLAALRQALDAIVARHEALRTIFIATDGVPHQVIAAHRAVKLPVIDLRGLPAASRQAEAQRRFAEEGRRPFDLSHDLMLRALLARLDDDDHALLLALHHIASDGWSEGILFRELGVLYAAFSAGEAARLPELPIQYADFAIWQRERLQGDVLEAQLAYWRQQLAGIPAALDLPTDRPRPSVQTFCGARQVAELPRSLMETLQALSRREGATLFMTLLAAFQTLLSRYSGQEDVVVGTPIASRGHTELEGLIGFFANTLALRADFAGDPPFRELLGRVRETALAAYAHQDLPFEKLVAELQCERDMSRSPMFQAMFALQNTPASPLELAGLTVTRLEVENATAKFDLLLSVTEQEHGLRASLEYNTDLFEEATITRMLGHFRTLLEGIAADPDARLSALPLLTQAERRQLLVEWNATEREYPRGRCLHHLFEEQVARTPDAVAVTFEGRHLTYRELNRRANQLAHHLQSLGVGPERLVGICVERSLEMVVGLLGILKAGGAYVPLDPAYPRERLAFMLADAQVPILLTQERLVASLPQHGAQILRLDADWGKIAREPATSPDSGATPDNLAYGIYTSGSTGQPKGALNTHAGITNRLLWMQDVCQLTAADRVLQKTPFSFDVSVWEFFWPLATGARLVVARPEGHRDPAYLVEVIAKEQITTLHFVPSMLQVFLEEAGVERCASLRQVMCSGEALPFDLQERFFARLAADLHNWYGPTEAAVDVTHWKCQRRSPRESVPIGRPIANTQLYVLDRHMQPVPIGVAGELYIGGVGVGRGYWNQADRTAERFIPNPFLGEVSGGEGQGSRVKGLGVEIGGQESAVGGAPAAETRPLTFDPRPLPPAPRLYRTGDQVRYLSDGNLEFLGRLDDQVKIRGVRIELGEIEAVLGQHPAVQDCVVVACDDAPGGKRLVAYVVPRNDDRPPTTEFVAEMRRYLKEKLPESMVPSAFLMLDALPVTPNGKLDRRALPKPDGALIERRGSFVAPRTPLEEQVAAIWGAVLALPEVGVEDDFFELGGHSLLAMQVVSRVRGAFGIDLPLRRLFETPTVAGLAVAILQNQAEHAEQGEMARLLAELEGMPEYAALARHGEEAR